MRKARYELQSKVAKLIREHLEAERKAALESVMGAFGISVAKPEFRGVSSKVPRRKPEDRAVLREKLYMAICAGAGETMATLSARVGERTIALHASMLQLKKAGRIRSAGERNFTRYFPMASVKSA